MLTLWAAAPRERTVARVRPPHRAPFFWKKGVARAASRESPKAQGGKKAPVKDERRKAARKVRVTVPSQSIRFSSAGNFSTKLSADSAAIQAVQKTKRASQ